jgi:putative photosynthetic complex assembly protein 2
LNRLALAALFVIAAWWISTAFVLRLVWLRRDTHVHTMAGAGVLSLASLGWLVEASFGTSDAAHYAAFLCALAIWGGHELAFLLGFVTGPRRTPCPPGAHGWARFRHATAAVIHHEIALAATVALIGLMTWDAPNQTGTQAFTVLWVMRLSAKLNLFLGVRSVSEDFIPERLTYLATYFRRRAFNPLMPLSLVGGAVATFVVLGGTHRVGDVLVGTLLALALLEHLFLAFPLNDGVLWRWATRSSPRAASLPPQRIVDPRLEGARR